MAKISKYKTLWFILLLVVAGIMVAMLYLPNHSKEKKTLTVGFIMYGEMEEDGWNGEHYHAIETVCKEQGVNLVVKENVSVTKDACSQAIKELAEKGAQMIVLDSSSYTAVAQEVFEEYPEIAFYGISSESHVRNINAYFVRMYQARYLAGIIAGMQTENGKIGYVAAMPNNEVNRGISAFTLGVKRVNPAAEVIVVWTGSWDDEGAEVQAATLLIEDEQVDVLTYHQDRDYVIRVAEENGIASIGYHKYYEGYTDNYLTAVVCDWEVLYRTMLHEFQQGKGNAEKNYWIGMEKGVVGLYPYSGLVTEEMIAEVEKAKAELLSGKDVFSGVIYDNEGNLRCGELETISDEMLLEHFDWYTEGVRVYEE